MADFQVLVTIRTTGDATPEEVLGKMKLMPKDKDWGTVSEGKGFQILNAELPKSTDGGHAATFTVYANSKEELEEAALSEARDFFGMDADLEVSKSYHLMRNRSEGTYPDKKWLSNIAVRERVTAV